MSKKLSQIFVIIVLIISCTGCELKLSSGTDVSHEFDYSVKPEKSLNSGDTIERGTFFKVSNVSFLYDGNMFLVKNDESVPVRISYTIVGVKNDGTYESLYLQGLSGIDQEQYDKDMSENGWAVENVTNCVGAGEKQEMYLNLLTTDDLDVDDDGFLDIVFKVSPQNYGDKVVASSDDPKSEVYKIKID